MAIRLHTRYQNSAGQRVRIVLNLKGLDYEYQAIGSISSPEYLSVNPQGLMPAIEIDGQVVAQSMAIVELLEELFPEPSIFPSDPFLRAQSRSFANSIAADLHPINNNRIRKYLSNVVGADSGTVERWYGHWVATGFAGLEAQLSQRPQQWRFCYGNEPSIADAFLVPQMDNARRFGCSLTPYPLLQSIDAECRRLGAFQRAAPENQPDYPIAEGR